VVKYRKVFIKLNCKERSDFKYDNTFGEDIYLKVIKRNNMLIINKTGKRIIDLHDKKHINLFGG
jgi:hypothetical protein